METPSKILFVSADPYERQKAFPLMNSSRAVIDFMDTPGQVLELCSQGGEFAVVFLAINSASEGHSDFLKTIQTMDPTKPVVLISPLDDVKFYVDCLRKGAFDYLLRPVDWKEFMRICELALQQVESTGPIGTLAA
jgi:DNA-binding NtrC family response regulator